MLLQNMHSSIQIKAEVDAAITSKLDYASVRVCLLRVQTVESQRLSTSRADEGP